MRNHLTTFIVIIIGFFLSIVPIKAQLAPPCQPCVPSTSTIETYDYSDLVNGCQFRIEYEKFTDPCNDHWDIKIRNVKLLTPCSTYSAEQIIALGMIVLLQENPMGFPMPTNGGSVKIRVRGPACWQFLETVNPINNQLERKVSQCNGSEDCCQFYTYKHNADCNDMGIVHNYSVTQVLFCDTPEPSCKFGCDDAWKIFFRR